MKISDEARELTHKLVYDSPATIDGRKITAYTEPLIQRALDAARNRALEDAAVKARKLKGIGGIYIADAIRAMKVPS